MEDDSVIATGISGVRSGHRLEAGEARLAKKMKQDQCPKYEDTVPRYLTYDCNVR